MATQDAHRSPPRILVVDDDPLVLTLTGGSLRNAGFEVFEAADGPEALECLEARAPPVVLTDYCLPSVTGPDLLKSIRSRSESEIIVFSAFAEDELAATARECGAFAFLSKPIDPRQLLPIIFAALHRSGTARRSPGSALAAAAEDPRREINIVTGILMERFRMTQHEAYQRLRHYARNQRQALAQVARDILAPQDRATELLCAVSQCTPNASPMAPDTSRAPRIRRHPAGLRRDDESR